MSGLASTQQQKPDLTFYQKTKDKKFIYYDSTPFLETQKWTLDIFADKSLTQKIGNIYNNKEFVSEPTGNVVYSSGNRNYFFPFGTLVTLEGKIINNLQIKDNDTKLPKLQPNSSNIRNIVSGSGDLLGASGYMVTTSDDTDVRKVEVYFTHNK